MYLIVNKVEIFCFAETWVTSERIKKFSWYQKLTCIYDIVIVEPFRERQKGRAKVGMIIGVDKTLYNLELLHKTQTSVIVNIC